MNDTDVALSYADRVDIYAKSRALEERRLLNRTICAGCRFGLVFRRHNQFDVHVSCAQFGVVPSDIVECSRYMEWNKMDLSEMGMLALPIDGRVGVRDGSYR